jgi:hypothetical protein
MLSSCRSSPPLLLLLLPRPCAFFCAAPSPSSSSNTLFSASTWPSAMSSMGDPSSERLVTGALTCAGSKHAFTKAGHGNVCAFSSRRCASNASRCFCPYCTSDGPKHAAGNGSCAHPKRSGAPAFSSVPALNQPMSCQKMKCFGYTLRPRYTCSLGSNSAPSLLPMVAVLAPV